MITIIEENPKLFWCRYFRVKSECCFRVLLRPGFWLQELSPVDYPAARGRSENHFAIFGRLPLEYQPVLFENH